MITNLPTFKIATKFNFKTKFYFVILLTIFGLLQHAYAQVSAYTVQQLPTPTVNPPTFPIAGATLVTPASTAQNDVAIYSIPLPFAFTFNGVVYPAGTNLRATENGYVTFGTSLPLTNSYTPLSSATGYDGAISLYGANLTIPNLALNGIRYKTELVGGVNVFKIEWIVRRGIDTNNLIFQLWLYQTSNLIEMHYNTFNPSSTAAIQGQIGLRGLTNADFKNLDYAIVGNWPGVAPSPVGTMPLGAVNTATVVTRNSTAQIQTTSNRLFRFIPVTCFAPTAITIPPATIASTTATVNWTLPTTGTPTGYNWEIRTSGLPGTAGSIQSGTVGSGITSLNLSGLTAGTTYTFYIRTDCGSGDLSSWTTGTTFTTLCNPLNVPFYEPFNNGVTTNTVAPYHGVLPTCTSQQQNIGSMGNNWVTTYSDTYYPDAAMDEYVLMYNGQNPGNTNPANVWFYTQGINLVGGTTYRLSYFYGGTATPSTVQNKMEVAYFSAPVVGSLVSSLDNHPNIKSSSFENIVNFTPTVTGVYYMGFRAYSNANNGQMYLDDIQVVLSLCKKPTAVSVSSISFASAVLSWTAPTPAPAGGYAYYFNTTGTAPVNSTIPNGFTAAGVNNVTLTGLTGSTNYYFWVRSSCGGGEFGEWVALNNAGSPFFTTLPTPPSYCTPAPSSVDGTGIINVAFGTINNPSGAEPGNYGNYSSLFTNTPQGATIPVAITFNTATFDYNTKIWVDWNNNGIFGPFDGNNDGDFLDAVDDATNELIYTGVSAATSPNTLNASFTVPAGASLGFHRIRIGGTDFNNEINGTIPNQGPCYSGFPFGSFEDYSINVVVPPPPIGISSTSSTQCANVCTSTISLTTPIGNFDTYSWSPSAGVSGSASTGWIICSGTSLTYTLTGLQPTAPFSTNTVTFNYIANQPPTPITINTPSGTVACPSSPGIPLIASGGVVSGFAILNENFNTGAPTWTRTNTSTGGVTTSPDWTIRPNGYNRPPLFNSNDNTSFILSDSDGQGSGTTTNVNLTSPSFSLVGFVNATLSFWHYYRLWTPSTASVQVSTNGGGSWTTLQAYTNVTQGAPTAFANVVLDLTPYVGQANVQIRFNYVANWGWYWAIDNFLVSGSASSAVTWTPTTGLFNDAAGTSPYMGTGASTVYVITPTNTTYTATASTPAPICSTSASQAITVVNVNGGTASSNQTICGNTASALTVSGFTGSVTSWQSATNAAFTTGVATIPSSASTTLTPAQMGTITATKYFRAAVTVSGCTVYSNVITITVSSTTWNGFMWSNGLPSATKSAIFAGNYSSSGNLTACTVTVNSGAVVFNANHNLIVYNTVAVVGGTLTFNDTASLVQINEVVNAPSTYNGGNTGGIIYIRDTKPMKLYDYTYWSTPVNPQTLIGVSPLTPANFYFQFDPFTINNWQSVSANGLMTPGRGYIIRAPNVSPFNPSSNNIYTATISGSMSNNGTPNNGIITYPIEVGVGTSNMIGNPYPSAIDADAFLSYAPNTAVVGGTIYLWTHNTPINGANQYTSDDYASYNLTGSIGTAAVNSGVNNSAPNGYIAAAQSFFIEGLTNANVTFNNAMRVAGSNNQFFRTTEQEKVTTSIEKNRVWLELFNDNGLYKQALVGYIEGATNNYDRSFDGKTLEAGNSVSIYSFADNNNLSIQGRALPFDINDIVPLGYKSAVNGNLTIKLSNFDGLFENTNVFLEDKLLNIIHDLKASDYNFATTAGTFDDRFQLRYTSVLSNNQVNFNENTVIAYKDNADIIINSSNIDMQNIKVFDIRGRQLFDSKQISSSEYKISNLLASNQVLMITVTASNGNVITKKIIF